MMDDKIIRRASNAFGALIRYANGVDDDLGGFARMLLGFSRDRLWETGWVVEWSGKFQKANSLQDFVENYLGQSIPWVYAQLALNVPLDSTKDNLISECYAAFTQAILDETGKTPKAWYEGKVVEKVPKAMTPTEAGKLGGRGKKAISNAKSLPSASPYSREHRIAQLKKAGRDDLVAKVADGSLSANAAAIQAGLKKPPKPRPTTALELLDYAGEVLKTDSRIGTLFALMNALSPAELKAAKQWLNPKAA